MNVGAAFHAGRLTAYLNGELDHHVALDTLREIEDLLDDYLPRDCVLDLSGLSFMDSSGIALIIRINRRMTDLGGRAWIENSQGQPQRVIDAAGIERLIQVKTANKKEYIG